MTATVRLLTPADVPAAMRIKDAAGWNQTENDWLNLLRLAPQTSFCLECDGSLAATTTAVCYESRLAWIGMVLTHPAYRRRGFALRLMEHTLHELTARGVPWIKLDATEMGAPLYRRLGFQDEACVERWRAVAVTAEPLWRPTTRLSACAQLDRAAFGADRSRLLALLASSGCAVRPAEGYAMARPGSQASYFGPCVSRSPETARALLDWFLARKAQEPVYWDLLPHNVEAVRLARASGFQPVRRLVRMVRQSAPAAAPLVPDDSRVYAIAGLEYG